MFNNIPYYMSKKEKRLEQLKVNPTSLSYKEIESLFDSEMYDIERGKWSHKLIFHKDSWQYVSIPIHGWDCKGYYKSVLKNFYIVTNQ